jgi:hypothetical protein
MAKKAAKGELIFNLNIECIIKVPDEHRKSFEKDLKRKELSLSGALDVDGSSLGVNIYPDHVDGTFTFEKLDPNSYKLVVKGKYKTQDDFDDLPKIKKLSSVPELMLEYVCDLDSNWYYIDGDEDKKVELGTLVL